MLAPSPGAASNRYSRTWFDWLTGVGDDRSVIETREARKDPLGARRGTQSRVWFLSSKNCSVSTISFALKSNGEVCSLHPSQLFDRIS